MDDYRVWESDELANLYLENVRGAIPFAVEQIKIILRIIANTIPDPKNILDIGCGDGILGRAVVNQFAHCKGVFLDLSEFMINAAREKMGVSATQHKFIVSDYSNKNWVDNLKDTRFDIILSGFSIHHQPDKRKKEIYSEIYHLLNDGGIFLNLEHVASKSGWSAALNNQNFIDSLHNFHVKAGSKKSREEIAAEYYNRQDKDSNILAPVEDQVNWLGDIGYKFPECFFKIFEIALFGGTK